MPRRNTERTRYRLVLGDLERADAAVVRGLEQRRGFSAANPPAAHHAPPVAEVAFSLLIGVGCIHGMTARGRGPHFWDMTSYQFPCGHEGFSLSTGDAIGWRRG